MEEELAWFDGAFWPSFEKDGSKKRGFSIAQRSPPVLSKNLGGSGCNRECRR
jgi:hypothetical protein